MQKKIDSLAELWNKTKDPKYKDLWYKLIREWSYGRTGTLSSDASTIIRRTSDKRSSGVHKTNDSF
jgi:hypothetical protein